MLSPRMKGRLVALAFGAALGGVVSYFDRLTPDKPVAPTVPPPTATSTPVQVKEAPDQPAPDGEWTEGVVAPGTTFATPWRRYESPVDGPHIVIEAGLHGDEIAGILAVDDLSARLQLLSGSASFLPRMNRPACDAGNRSVNQDLNHAFPGDLVAETYEPRLAAGLMAWMGEQDADVVITLHESRYLYDGKNPKTFGQTVVYGVTPMPEIVSRVLSRANTKALEPNEEFRSNYYPIATSSTEQFVAAYGMLGLCLETWRGLPLESRIRRHEEFVLALLDELGIRYGLATPALSAGNP